MVNPTYGLSTTEQQALNIAIPVEQQDTYRKTLGAHSSLLGAAKSEDEYKTIIKQIFPGVSSNQIDQLALLAIHIMAAEGNPEAKTIQDTIEQAEGFHNESDTTVEEQTTTLPAPDQDLEGSFFQGTPTFSETPPPPLESLPPLLLATLQEPTTSPIHINKEAQLWLVNVVAVELFTVVNEIVAAQAKMRLEWNAKMTQIKEMMLTMAKDMREIAIEAGKARYAAAWAEIGMLFAEAAIGFTTLTMQVASFGISKMIESKYDKSNKTEQDYRNEIKTDRNKFIANGGNTKDISAATQKIQSLHLERQNALDSLKGIPTTDPTYPQLKQNFDQADNKLNSHLANPTTDADKIAVKEYKIEHQKGSLNLISEHQKLQDIKSLQDKFSLINQMISSGSGAAISTAKAVGSMPKAAEELRASTLEAHAKFMSQIYQALQETTSSIGQSAYDAISKQIDTLLDLLKSVQAIQSQR